MTSPWPKALIDELTPPRIPLAVLPTPLTPLERISRELGGPRLWIKRDDLTGSVLSGNKVRKLEYTIAHAKAQGCNLLITCGGLQSNHCRATAFAGAQLGFPVHLVLRGGESEPVDGNLFLDTLAGARISRYEPTEYTNNLDALLDRWYQHYLSEGYKPYIIPTGASDDVGVWGYLQASLELKQDFERLQIAPHYIVCATGSGGTQAGLTLGSYHYGLDSAVVGMAVCDDVSYFTSKVAQDINAWQARYLPQLNQSLHASLKVSVNDHYIGPGYGKAQSEVFDTIAWLAREEGILLDPVYTGKAFHGLIREIANGCFSDTEDIVFIHTGGGFGLFPYRQQALERAQSPLTNS